MMSEKQSGDVQQASGWAARWLAGLRQWPGRRAHSAAQRDDAARFRAIFEHRAVGMCETALDVSGARGAVLIRWEADTETGELHYATEGTGRAVAARPAAQSTLATSRRR